MEAINGMGGEFDATSKGGTDMTISELAREALEHFTNDNARHVWALKDGAPEWVEELAREAHGSMLPDDWTFEAVVGVLGALADESYTDGDEARDYAPELCDSLVDIGTGALLEWAREHLERVQAANEAMDEGAAGIEGSLMMAQHRELMEVFESVSFSLEGELGDRIKAVLEGE